MLSDYPLCILNYHRKSRGFIGKALRAVYKAILYFQGISSNDDRERCKAGLCPDCGLTFETEKALKTHLLMAHSVRRDVKCIEVDCHEVFQSLGELASHVSSAHDKVLNLKVK